MLSAGPAHLLKGWTIEGRDRVTNLPALQFLQWDYRMSKTIGGFWLSQSKNSSSWVPPFSVIGGGYMSFFDSLKSLFGGSTSSSGPGDSVYWIYVRCHRCGEVIKTRLDLLNSLTLNDEGGYVASKTLVGNRHCFERIEVTLTFDENRRLINREIQHGAFITAEEFDVAQGND
jgi:hypothetical protein